ncbi:TolC family protein, partial [Pelobium sp.]
VITNGQLFDALVTVNKEINTRKRSHTYIQSIQLSKDSLYTQKALSQLTLAQNIAAQYINTLGDQELLKLSKEILSLLQKEDDLLKRLTQNAVFKQTDYLAFKVNLEQQKLVVSQNFNQFKTDLSTLQYLSGLSDTTTYSLKPLDYSVAEVPKFEESLTAKVYQIDSLKTINNLALLNLNYQPRLSAFADGGYNTSFPTQAYKNFGVSTGLSLNIPIYDGGQRKMTAQQIKLQQMSIMNYKYFAQNQYQQRENQLKNIVKSYEALISESQKQISYSKTLVDANALQLGSGDVRMTDYLLALANYLQLRANIIQNKINELQAINQLRYFTLK